jgi:hypothetical protein
MVAAEDSVAPSEEAVCEDGVEEVGCAVGRVEELAYAVNRLETGHILTPDTKNMRDKSGGLGGCDLIGEVLSIGVDTIEDSTVYDLAQITAHKGIDNMVDLKEAELSVLFLKQRVETLSKTM